MPTSIEHVVTPALLRDWPLPDVAGSKYGRGQIVVVGGALRSPGAAMLAGVAALRVGAGRLTLAVARSVAASVATSIVEAGVVPLDETDDHVDGASIRLAASDVTGADTVLVGPGLDDADETARLLTALVPLLDENSSVVLDAFALGVLPTLPRVVDALRGRVVLTPNKNEAARLLGRGDDEDAGSPDEVREIARRYDAVVSCFGVVADPDGESWTISTGTGGLATSGSGDVLAGAIAGLLARGATAAQAAVWATHAHSVAGDRLAVEVGPLGYLAGELLGELPRVLVEVGA